MTSDEAIDVYERTARRNFPHGIPDGCNEDYRVYEVPSMQLTMRGREWPELVAFPEYLSDGTVVTHCCVTTQGFGEPDGPEIARAIVYGKVARYRECVKGALSGAGEVVFHAD